MTDLPRKSSQLTDPEPWHLARDADARKTATYRATRKGIEVTEAYAELRRDLLISTTAGIEGSADALAAAGNLLDLMAGHYDQAAKLAVTRRY